MRVLAYSNGGDGRMSSPTHRFQMGKNNCPLKFTVRDRSVN